MRPLLAAVLAALVLPAPAGATEFFASPDETRTGQDCLTVATACALGKALEAPPFVAAGNPIGVHQVTLLPGSYDTADVDGGSSFPIGQFFVESGLTVRGLPGAERPLITLGDPGGGDAAVELTTGGVLRDLRFSCAAFSCIAAQGFPAAVTPFGDLPAVVERVSVIAAPAAPAGTEAYGLSLVDSARAANVDIDHRATSGAAITISPRTGTISGLPNLVAATASASSAPAIEITGGQEGTPTPLPVAITNSLFHGTPDLRAESGSFSSAPAPGFTPNPIHLTLASNAFRTKTLVGPASIVAETGTVTANDPGLDANAVPAAGSPLIDAGVAASELGPLDVRGAPRIDGAAPDIGAYELQRVPIAGPPASGSAPAPAPAADTTGPQLGFSGKAPKQLRRSQLTKGKGVTLRFTTSEAVSGGRLELVSRTKRKGKTTDKVLASTKLSGAPAGQLTARLKGKRSKLGKGKRKALLKLTLTDATGNATVLERNITLR